MNALLVVLLLHSGGSTISVYSSTMHPMTMAECSQMAKDTANDMEPGAFSFCESPKELQKMVEVAGTCTMSVSTLNAPGGIDQEYSCEH